ncbi:MAG: metal-dependent transcriptional regulator [Deltaproteobacteria bacterium]|nr:MAG: metal-dependent transcriptional regulator [Deltaproteobacteria bacterium]
MTVGTNNNKEKPTKEKLSRAVEDYLRAIYKLEERGKKVSTTALAEQLAVAPASVTKMLKRLASMELVEHEPYYGVGLTPSGEKTALEIVRHHRLIELFLAEVVGVPWDRVHAEAHQLEHALSEYLEDKLAQLLDDPDTDPHGQPIPSKDGEIIRRHVLALDKVEGGTVGVVAEVDDHDAGLLRHVASLGLFPKTPVRVIARQPADGVVQLDVDGTEQLLSLEVAKHLWITPDTEEKNP